jgi:ABC-2 type transport system permease protein
VASLHSDPPPTASPAAAALPAARRDPAGEIRPTGGGRSSPLFQLTLAKVRDFAREPEALFWVFAFPLLLAVALGLAFRDKAPDRVPVAIVRGAGAEAAAAAIAHSNVLAGRILDAETARLELRTGKISLLIDASAPGPAKPHNVVFRYDPTRPDAHIASLEAEEALERAAGRIDVVTVRTERVTEQGARYIDFLIPGLLGMNLMGTGIWSLAFSITVARQRHLLKRLIATPMRRSDYLLSQMFGRLVFLPPEIVVLVGLGWLAFGVVVHGSLLLLLATCLLGAMSFCGLGLLIASRVRTVEGASGWANMVMLPMWLLSGVFFSSERFPDRLQPVIHALPLTALIDALRGIINDGRSISGVGMQLAIVAAWGIASFLVALRVFRWR